MYWEQVSGHRDKKKGCYLLHLKKEEIQQHILSLLCCLRTGSQHLVVSLTWEISGGLGQHDNAVPGKYWRFSFPRGGQRRASVPWGSAVGLAEGRASVEPFWTLPKKATGTSKEFSPRETVTQTIKNLGPRGKGQPEPNTNTPGEPWSAVPSREGTDRFRDTPVRKWFSSQYLYYVLSMQNLHESTIHKKRTFLRTFYTVLIFQKNLWQKIGEETERRNKYAARSSGSSLLQHLLRLGLPDAMNECQLQPTVQNADSPSTAKSTRSRRLISQMRLSLQVKGL